MWSDLKFYVKTLLNNVWNRKENKKIIKKKTFLAIILLAVTMVNNNSLSKSVKFNYLSEVDAFDRMASVIYYSIAPNISLKKEVLPQGQFEHFSRLVNKFTKNCVSMKNNVIPNNKTEEFRFLFLESYKLFKEMNRLAIDLGSYDVVHVYDEQELINKIRLLPDERKLSESRTSRENILGPCDQYFEWKDIKVVK